MKEQVLPGVVLALCLLLAIGTAAQASVIPLGGTERIELTHADISFELQKGWIYVDVTEGLLDGGEPLVVDGKHVDALAYVMMSNADGAIVINFVAMANDEGTAADLNTIAEAYGEKGAWIQCGGERFFVYSAEDDTRTALMCNENMIVSITGDTLLIDEATQDLAGTAGMRMAVDEEVQEKNEEAIASFIEQFDAVIQSIQFS